MRNAERLKVTTTRDGYVSVGIIRIGKVVETATGAWRVFGQSGADTGEVWETRKQAVTSLVHWFDR